MGTTEHELTAALIEDGQGGSRNQRIKLELDGYRVLVWHKDALEAEARSADLVFVDLDPRNPSSVELLRRLRRALADDTSLVIMSNYDAEQLRDRGVDLAMNEAAIKNAVSRGDRAQTSGRTD